MMKSPTKCKISVDIVKAENNSRTSSQKYFQFVLYWVLHGGMLLRFGEKNNSEGVKGRITFIRTT
jgi:hypothetical protein